MGESTSENKEESERAQVRTGKRVRSRKKRVREIRKDEPRTISYENDSLSTHL